MSTSPAERSALFEFADDFLLVGQVKLDREHVLASAYDRIPFELRASVDAHRGLRHFVSCFCEHPDSERAKLRPLLLRRTTSQKLARFGRSRWCERLAVHAKDEDGVLDDIRPRTVTGILSSELTSRLRRLRIVGFGAARRRHRWRSTMPFL
jgi:hypothetical protein